MKVEEQLASLLTKRALRLAVVETTTGGLICARMVSVAGSSKFFDRGIIAYSREAKKQLLGLSEDLLKTHGSVSKETAEAMAQQVRERSRVEIGLAETGIAGPVKGKSPKPIGTACIAVATEKTCTSIEEVFKGDRDAIRKAIAARALRLIIEVVGAGEKAF